MSERLASEIILNLEADTETKVKLADTLAFNTVTHNDNVKDWFFQDDSILRLCADNFHDINLNIKREDK